MQYFEGELYFIFWWYSFLSIFESFVHGRTKGKDLFSSDVVRKRKVQYSKRWIDLTK